MIAKMLKVFIVGKGADSDRLLDALRGLGAVHLEAVDRSAAVADEKTLAGIDHLARAAQILAKVEPAGDKPDVSAIQGAEELLEIHRKSAERKSRLTALHRQIEQLEIWGDVRLEHFRQLADEGIDISFFALPLAAVDDVQADCVHVIRELPDQRALIAVAVRGGRTDVPEDAEPIELPQRDRPTIRAEAAAIDDALADDTNRELQLAHLIDEIRAEHVKLQRQAEYTVAQRGGFTHDRLFAIQGWVPADRTDSLAGDLAAAGIDAAVQAVEPEPDEEPPTLIRYPRWAEPIKALFEMLGTVPGFRELDLSGFFMIAMPIFVAMLIGDGGYGLLFLGVTLVMRRKLIAAAGSPAANLLLIFSLTTVAWGVLTASFFGITPQTIAGFAGFTQVVDDQTVGHVAAMVKGGTGVWATIGKALYAVAPLYREDAAAGRDIIIQLSFIIGCLHLVSAQLRQAIARAPDIRFLANVGWAIVLPAMLGVIWQMFFIGISEPWPAWIFVLLILGVAMAVLFSFPSRNPVKMLLMGVVGNIMPLINAFSDTISYIRLMAVGLASYYIAYSFNLLAGQIADGSHWVFAIPVLLIGHGLNIAMGILAVLAHGVRLNMLEFSSNAGVQWSGYPYKPFAETFAKKTNKEI